MHYFKNVFFHCMLYRVFPKLPLKLLKRERKKEVNFSDKMYIRMWYIEMVKAVFDTFPAETIMQ